MFYAYVIKSIKSAYCYKGHCGDLEKRLREHNSGKTISNRAYAPFTIVYFEEFENRADAIAREKYFKTAAGRRFLKQKIGSFE